MTAHADSSIEAGPDTVVLLDESGRELGVADRADCHRGEGRLHRALTCLVFDSAGRLLFARRAAGKPLWPRCWDATVATHQMPGESDLDATRRRLRQELGIEAFDVMNLSRIVYRARYDDDWSEREVCAVLLARAAGEPAPARCVAPVFNRCESAPAAVRPAPEEIDAVHWVALDELPAFTAAERITPWFLLAWDDLQRHRAGELDHWLGYRRRGRTGGRIPPYPLPRFDSPAHPMRCGTRLLPPPKRRKGVGSR